MTSKIRIEHYNPEEIFRAALEKIPEKYSQDFIASWLVLKFSPFGENLKIYFFPDAQQVGIYSMFYPKGILKEKRFAMPFLRQMQQFLMTFAENLGRYFFPGMRLYLTDESFCLAETETSEAPLLVKKLQIGTSVEEATRVRMRQVVQGMIYSACVQLYANQRRMNDLPKSAFKVDEKSGLYVPNLERLERIREFCNFRDYLIRREYIDSTYYPQKDLRTIDRALNRRLYSLRYCPICGAEIEKPRANSSTCGSRKCTRKKSNVKKLIRKWLKQNPNLTETEILKMWGGHEGKESKITKYKPYVEVKDIKALVETILKELR